MKRTTNVERNTISLQCDFGYIGKGTTGIICRDGEDYLTIVDLEMTMPALEDGSEKQIAWAEKIRARQVSEKIARCVDALEKSNIADLLSQYNQPNITALFEMVLTAQIANIVKETSAKNIINRFA